MLVFWPFRPHWETVKSSVGKNQNGKKEKKKEKRAIKWEI